jgi:hypothetical protein
VKAHKASNKNKKRRSSKFESGVRRRDSTENFFKSDQRATKMKNWHTRTGIELLTFIR